MLDYLVLYQSESGNTKKIAASIFSRLPGNSGSQCLLHRILRTPRKLQYGSQ